MQKNIWKLGKMFVNLFQLTNTKCSFIFSESEKVHSKLTFPRTHKTIRKVTLQEPLSANKRFVCAWVFPFNIADKGNVFKKRFSTETKKIIGYAPRNIAPPYLKFNYNPKAVSNPLPKAISLTRYVKRAGRPLISKYANAPRLITMRGQIYEILRYFQRHIIRHEILCYAKTAEILQIFN